MVPKAGMLLYEGFVCLGAWGALRALMGTPGGAVPPQCSGGFAAGTCAPHFACTQAPCRRCPGPILFFRGAGNGPAPKDRRICLAHPAGKAVLYPLHNAPESARKDHYCGETPPRIQRISACFNADRCKELPSRQKHTYSPKTQNRCLP